MYPGLGSYETFQANYVNKRNPATGMYWTVAQIAADMNVTEAQVFEWLNRAQTANLVEVENRTEPVVIDPTVNYPPGYLEGLQDAGIEIIHPVENNPVVILNAGPVPAVNVGGSGSTGVNPAPTADTSVDDGQMLPQVEYYNALGQPFVSGRDEYAYWMQDGRVYRGDNANNIVEVTGDVWFPDPLKAIFYPDSAGASSGLPAEASAKAGAIILVGALAAYALRGFFK